MELKFDNYDERWGAELLCPNCGFNYLHHDRVEVFERSEDAPQGVHVIVNDGRATVDSSLAGNPSSRRHGLAIHFWCEGCKATPLLTIAQHKGVTHVNITHTGEPDSGGVTDAEE